MIFACLYTEAAPTRSPSTLAIPHAFPPARPRQHTGASPPALPLVTRPKAAATPAPPAVGHAGPSTPAARNHPGAFCCLGPSNRHDKGDLSASAGRPPPTPPRRPPPPHSSSIPPVWAAAAASPLARARGRAGAGPASDTGGAAALAPAMLKFRGCQHFRQRLVCATLSGRPVRIDDIRSDDPHSPGLRDFEASFLRLLEKLTNGCVVEINETGGSRRKRGPEEAGRERRKGQVGGLRPPAAHRAAACTALCAATGC